MISKINVLEEISRVPKFIEEVGRRAYKKPKTKIPERPNFCAREICKFHTTCIGMTRMMASVTMFGI